MAVVKKSISLEELHQEKAYLVHEEWLSTNKMPESIHELIGKFLDKLSSENVFIASIETVVVYSPIADFSPEPDDLRVAIRYNPASTPMEDDNKLRQDLFTRINDGVQEHPRMQRKKGGK